MSFSPNKNLNLQATGTNINTWGVINNSNYSILDNNLGGRYNANVAGSSNVTVTLPQAQNLMHLLTGVITGNINYVLPAVGGIYQIINNTTGAFSVTATIAGGGAGIVVPQGQAAIVFTNPDVPNITGFVTASGNYFWGGTTTGSANAQVLASPNPGGYTLNQGALVSFIAGYSNSDSMTMNTNGTGVITTQKQTASGLTNLVTGDVIAGNSYTSLYNATAGVQVLLNPSGSSFGGLAFLNAGAGMISSGGNLSWGLTTEASISSAASTDLGTIVGNIANVTGTNTITGFGNSANTNNPLYFVRFSGALTLTNSGSLILPGGANIVTAAGDTLVAKFEGSSNWRVISYTTATPGVTAGTYTNATITVNSLGQLTAASSGTSGTSFNQQTFTTSSTWNKPAGFDTTSMVLVECWGAGGGAGQAGGGGGSYKYGWFLLSALSSSESVTVGAGGAGGVNNGSNGGSSSFGSHLTAFGGSGSTNNSYGGPGGGYFSSTASNNQNDTGGDGYGGTSTIPIGRAGYFTGGGGSYGNGGSFVGGGSIYGGGGGGAGGAGAVGGSSVFGGIGGTSSGTGQNGSAPGGGGGGGNGSNAAGSGAAGQIRVTVFR